MKNFGIIGVGGYIAPRHLEAIAKNNGQLVCAFDVNDSVGILDRYNMNTDFFTDLNQFEQYLKDKQKSSSPIDYLSICSPNHKHFKHIELALSNGINAICEKPLVLNEEQLDQLIILEKKYNKKVFTTLQLRLHQSIINLKNSLIEKEKYQIKLQYITSRGPWYHKSWKAFPEKSGGLGLNIGVHFFDMLTWIFGKCLSLTVELKNNTTWKGKLSLENANVDWLLSIDKNYLPSSAIQDHKNTYRSITINNKEIEFSTGFTDLHNELYTKILNGEGFTIDSTREAIRIVDLIKRNSK